MLRIAVCDDEKEMREIICGFLKNYPKVEAIDCFECGEAFLQKRGHYDLVFLDIDMSGMDGLETGRRIRKWDKQVYIVYVLSLIHICRKVRRYAASFLRRKKINFTEKAYF